MSVAPEMLETKSSEGWTPLQVAAIKQRVPMIEYLISVGANQRHRDKNGRNMIHSMLKQASQWSKEDRERLEKMLDLFDKEALKEMFLERCNEKPGALSPLAYFMTVNRGNFKGSEVVSILAKYSNGEDLSMINGEGDLPLHVAIKNSLSTQTATLLSLNRTLLYRENATGRTPLEMARDIYIASCVEHAPNIDGGYQRHYYPGQTDYNSVLHQPLSNFVKKDLVPEESKKRTWDICDAVDRELKSDGVERKRRIVSLFEANEVAKRVTGIKRYGGYQAVVNGGVVDNEGKPDVFSEWV